MSYRLLSLLFLVVLSVLPVAATAAEAAAAAPEPATLTVWNREIATFRTALARTTPEERAERAARRIADLDDEHLLLPVTLTRTDVGGIMGLVVSVGDRILFVQSEADMDREAGETLAAVGEQVKDRLAGVMAARHEQMNLQMQAVRLALALVATLGLLVALWLVVRGCRRILGRLSENAFVRLPRVLGLDLKPVALFLAQWAVKAPAWFVGLAAVYLWLTFVLSCFPYSRPWAGVLAHFLWNTATQIGLAMLGALPGLCVVAIIVVLTRIAVRALNAIFLGIEQGRLDVGWMLPETARATRRIATVLLWMFAITVSYPYLPGSSSDAFKGVSVFAGLMLTLGSAGLVNQVMSGLLVVYSRTMRVGDIVKVGEVVGTVIDLGFLSTKVRTPVQEEITIPNAVLVGNSVTNYSRFDGELGMVLTANVTIGYDTPWRQVHALLELAASRTSGLRRDPAPFVIQKALDDFYVAYELRTRLERPETRFEVQSRLHAQIQDAFNEHGVQIMSPHFVEQPAQTVVVAKNGWAPPPAKPLTPAGS